MATSNKGIDSGSGNRNELEKMLANYSSLIAELFSAMSDGVMGPAQIAGDSSPEKIIERLIEQDLALKKEVEEVENRLAIQREINTLQQTIAGNVKLTNYCLELNSTEKDKQLKDVEGTLMRVEELLEQALCAAKLKMKQINAAESANVSDVDIVNFSFNIGTKYGASAPPNWTNSNQLRPYPTELDMAAGELSFAQCDSKEER
eukprot:m.60210 g.60210  ORF g.60210 m.60210 type:complete len:204 (+) comp11304_c0_seq1:357-968(+)